MSVDLADKLGIKELKLTVEYEAFALHDGHKISPRWTFADGTYSTRVQNAIGMFKFRRCIFRKTYYGCEDQYESIVEDKVYKDAR